MRSAVLMLGSFISGAVCLSAGPMQSPTATLFEGARLITGDGRAPIENAAFVVDRGRFTAIGTKGALRAPAGAHHVDLAGKTVIPALVDAHVHLGYRSGVTFTAANYTRQNVLDELDRFSYYRGRRGSRSGHRPRRPAVRDPRADARWRALPHGGPRLCDAEGRARRTNARRAVRGHDGGGGPARRAGARRQPSGHDQDLGRRPQRHGREVEAESQSTNEPVDVHTRRRRRRRRRSRDLLNDLVTVTWLSCM